MLRTLPQTRNYDLLQRLAAVALFTLLMGLAAKVRFEVGPVPITMQPFVVLLAGMVLGARDGALSMIAYLSLILSGMPIDTNGVAAAAFVGPTAGYLIGFVPAAFVTGYLVELGADRVWMRWLAGLVGVLIIYALGVPMLWLFLERIGNEPNFAMVWSAGVASFILPDMAKALVAAAVAEGGRAALLKYSL